MYPPPPYCPSLLWCCAVEKGKKECEEKTRKKAEKRKRRKEAKREGQKAVKMAKTPGSDGDREKSTGHRGDNGSGSGKKGNGGSSIDGDAVEEFVYIPVADRPASAGDGDPPASYKNDGSFLDVMKTELGIVSEGKDDTPAGN